MSVLNVVVIDNCNLEWFEDEVSQFLELNEDMICLDKTVYGITQVSTIDDEFGLRNSTRYSAIFQMEGERK